MNPVAYQGFLYGQFGIQQYDNPNAQLKCIDMQTGAVLWSTNGFGRGGTLLVNNRLLVLTEKGDLVLAAPNPNGYTQLGRCLAIPGYSNGDINKCWTAPAVADGRVYVRSTSFGACFDFSKPSLTLDPPSPSPANHFDLTVRTANGTPLDSNRLAGMEVRASTNLALSASAWPKLTNNLLLTNGVVRVLNVDGAPPRRYFIVREPQ
jgi:outer membrane protein assembly factor BamB